LLYVFQFNSNISVKNKNISLDQKNTVFVSALTLKQILQHQPQHQPPMVITHQQI